MGWTVFYGNWLVGAATVTWWLLFRFVIIPREERGLTSAFGETYLEYKVAVPRWLGRMRD